LVEKKRDVLLSRVVRELDEEDGVTLAARSKPSSKVAASLRAVAFAESLTFLSLGNPFWDLFSGEETAEVGSSNPVGFPLVPMYCLLLNVLFILS
jgi:hypothetical protein